MIRFVFPALVLGLLASCSVGHPPKANESLHTVKKVNIQRYAGKWYEVARFPQWFQAGCVSAIAQYSTTADGRIKVINTCIRKDGKQRGISGVAEPVDRSASRLRVSFPEKWYARLMPVPEQGNYCVLYLSSDYQHAIVGTPGRNALWFLSRSPALDQRQFDTMKRIATEQGFDVGKLVIDQHTRIGNQ